SGGPLSCLRRLATLGWHFAPLPGTRRAVAGAQRRTRAAPDRAELRYRRTPTTSRGASDPTATPQSGDRGPTATRSWPLEIVWQPGKPCRLHAAVRDQLANARAVALRPTALWSPRSEAQRAELLVDANTLV